MALETVTKKRTRDPEREVSVQFDFGENLEAMVAFFGAEVVHASAKGNMRVRCQSVIDGGIGKNLSDEEIQRRVTAWKPGVSLEAGAGYDPLAAFNRMGEEEKASFASSIAAALRKENAASSEEVEE